MVSTIACNYLKLELCYVQNYGKCMKVECFDAELSLHPGFLSEFFTLKALRGLDVDNDTILDSVSF